MKYTVAVDLYNIIRLYKEVNNDVSAHNRR